jgi:hypothetical protein
MTPPETPGVPRYADVRDYLLDMSSDVGLSSAFMAHVLLGGPKRERWNPSDPSDLGRCIKLLDAFPEARARIGEMAAHGKAWAALAGAWTELERLYHEEATAGAVAPKTYALMKKLVAEGEREDGWVRVGPMSSVRVGGRRPT